MANDTLASASPTGTIGLRIEPILVGLLMAQPLIVVVVLCQALRHKLIVADPRLSFRTSLESVLLAGGLNLIAPARLSELLKATYLRQQAQIPTNVSLSAIAVERLTDVAVILLLLPLIPALMPGGAGWAMLLAALVLAVVIGLMRAPIAEFVSRRQRGWVRDFVVGLVHSFGHRITSPRFLLGTLLGALSLASSLLVVHTYLKIASPVELGLASSLAVFVAGMAGGAAAVLPGAIGSYHAAVTAALVGLGLDVGIAFELSIGMHLVQYVLQFPAALAVVVYRNLGISALFASARALWSQGIQGTRSASTASTSRD